MPTILYEIRNLIESNLIHERRLRLAIDEIPGYPHAQVVRLPTVLTRVNFMPF
jgi:hypothetical protein